MEKAYLKFNQSNSVEIEDEIFKRFDEIENLILSSNSFYISATFGVSAALIVDHALKSFDRPVDILSSFDNCLSLLRLHLKFNAQHYFSHSITNVLSENQDEYWEIARSGFNYFWPQTTGSQDTFSDSCKMAEQRLDQLLDLICKNSSKPMSMLDIGCGPARYLYCALNCIDSFKSNLVGVDTGEDIIASNNNRKDLDKIQFIQDDVSCNSIKSTYDFVMCNGVAHHTGIPLSTLIPLHASLVAKGGSYFIFVYGDGGLELRSWEFLQKVLGRFDKTMTYNFLSSFIHPLRVQGIMDHTYGVFYRTTRTQIEQLLNENFKSFIRVPGIEGLDVTPELFINDPFFQLKAGSGNLRYLAFA